MVNGSRRIRATPAGNAMKVRTTGSIRLINTAGEPHRVEKAIGEFDFVRRDQNVAPVLQQQAASAARADEVRDVRAEQASDRARRSRPGCRSKRPVDTR